MLHIDQHRQTPMTTSLEITQGKGVLLSFGNGIKFSIQIGGGNYSDNYDFPISPITHNDPLPPSRRAEIAIFDSKGTWVHFEGGDTVKGYLSIDKVLELIPILQSLEGTPDAKSVAEAVKETLS